jgi:hypothetical protein
MGLQAYASAAAYYRSSATQRGIIASAVRAYVANTDYATRLLLWSR